MPSFGVKSLDRDCVAPLGGFVHQPHLGDVIRAQMQVETRVHHVLPWPHRAQRLDRAGVNLDAAAIADEHHHGDACRRHFGKHRVNRRNSEGLRKWLPDKTVGPQAVVFQL